jgi:hypothetical protein
MSCNDPSSNSSTDDGTTEEAPSRVTYCDGDRANNVWVEGANENGEGGICMLDTMTQAQVIYVLQRNAKARDDLQRVTTDTELKDWALTIPMLPGVEDGDKLQRQVNNNAASIPFYSVFAGKPPTAR